MGYFLWRIGETQGWRPETREGATFTTIKIQKNNNSGFEERAYLFGGLSRDLHYAIAYLTRDTGRRK